MKINKVLWSSQGDYVNIIAFVVFKNIVDLKRGRLG